MITIAIPVYNQAEYLPEAIESALNQSVECEVIVVVDGSPDDSLEIALQYEPQVKVINQVNKGLASARNTAIMNATGDYILPLDADDVLEKNCVEILEMVAQATDADVIAPSLREFGLADAVVILMASPSVEDFKEANRIGYFSAIKREALLECGGYSPRMNLGAEDYHLWFDLLSRGKKLVTIPQPLVRYRTKEHSMWQETKKHKEVWMAQIKKDFPSIFV